MFRKTRIRHLARERFANPATHMGDETAFEGALAVDAIAELLIESDVLGEELVGVEADFAKAEPARERFRMRHQAMAMALALMCRRYREILDQQMIRLLDAFDQGN